MTFGFDSNLTAPLASAAVMKKSTAKLGERCPRNSPLVGAVAPRLVFNGRLLVPTDVRNGGGVLSTLLVPTVESPPTAEVPVPPPVLGAKPNCVRLSRQKSGQAEN